jgi:hypothetical protein
MEGLLKKCAILLTALTMATSFAAGTTQTAEAAGEKMLFLYTGKAKDSTGYVDYPPYTQADFNDTAMAGVNRFVILGSPHWETYKDGVSGAYSYQTLINAINSTVNTIQSSNKAGTKLYIATPGLNSTSVPFSTIYPTIRDFLTNLKNSMGSNWNYVEGIYFNLEEMYTIPVGGTFDFTNLMNNPTVKLANDLAYFTRTTLGKKFIWAPIYSNAESIAAANIKKVGYVTNKTNIFDMVLLQPNYYFNGTCSYCQAPSTNLNGVERSIYNNYVTYRDGVPVVTRTNWQAEIGVQMEIDGKYYWGMTNPPISASTFQSRYEEYKNKFKSYLGTAPISHYAGNRTHWAAVKTPIHNFYYYGY